MCCMYTAESYWWSDTVYGTVLVVFFLDKTESGNEAEKPNDEGKRKKKKRRRKQKSCREKVLAANELRSLKTRMAKIQAIPVYVCRIYFLLDCSSHKLRFLGNSQCNFSILLNSLSIKKVDIVWRVFVFRNIYKELRSDYLLKRKKNMSRLKMELRRHKVPLARNRNDRGSDKVPLIVFQMRR